MGQQADFAKILCASLFNEVLSNYTTFSQIHPDGITVSLKNGEFRDCCGLGEYRVVHWVMRRPIARYRS
jgi:hypothetical protein